MDAQQSKQSKQPISSEMRRAKDAQIPVCSTHGCRNQVSRSQQLGGRTVCQACDDQKEAEGDLVATMSFRWFSTINQISMDMVLAERARTDEPLMVCKKRLEGATTPVLQQWFAARSNEESQNSEDAGEWRDIPVVLQLIPRE